MGIITCFNKASLFTRVAFLLLFLASVSSWIAFCTTSWSYINNNIINFQGYGLWRICAKSGSCSLFDGTRNDWFAGVQACEIFGFMGINVAVLLILLYIFVTRFQNNTEARVAIIISCFFGVAGHLTAVIVYGAMRTSLYSTRDNPDALGFSFGFAVVAAFFSLASGAVCLLDMFMVKTVAASNAGPNISPS